MGGVRAPRTGIRPSTASSSSASSVSISRAFAPASSRAADSASPAREQHVERRPELPAPLVVTRRRQRARRDRAPPASPGGRVPAPAAPTTRRPTDVSGSPSAFARSKNPGSPVTASRSSRSTSGSGAICASSRRSVPSADEQLIQDQPHRLREPAGVPAETGELAQRPRGALRPGRRQHGRSSPPSGRIVQEPSLVGRNLEAEARPAELEGLLRTEARDRRRRARPPPHGAAARSPGGSPRASTTRRCGGASRPAIRSISNPASRAA